LRQKTIKIMKQSIEYKIFERMKKAKRGTAFLITDFISYGNSKSCSKALERLTKEDKIMRVGRGIYVIPRKSKFFGRVGTLSIDEIVKSIAKRDKARIIPTGLFALNLLGLSTQVPMNAVFLTDGVPRKLMIGETPVVLKKTSPKNLAATGTITPMVIMALKSIGKEYVTESEIEKIVKVLKKENPKHVANDMKIAPAWIAEIMRKALTN